MDSAAASNSSFARPESRPYFAEAPCYCISRIKELLFETSAIVEMNRYKKALKHVLKDVFGSARKSG